MIDAYFLRVGEELECRPPQRIGGIRKAYLQSDGSVKDGDSGEIYSLAAWSNLVKDTSSNAWIQVTARGKKLSYFRDLLNNAVKSQPDTDDENADSVKSGWESEPESQQTEEVSLVASEMVLQPNLTEPDVTYPEVNVLHSELESLKSQIASLHTRMNSLSVSASEDGTEADIIEKLRDRLLRLSPDEFERLVGEYLKAKGFSNVVITQRSHDGGIDGYCEITFVGVKVAFQAKRYTSNTIGIDPVQRLQGSITGRYDRGIFITTSDYTPGAREYVENPTVRITLVNGERLLEELTELGLGVKAVTVVKHEVDEGFFADLENRQ